MKCIILNELRINYSLQRNTYMQQKAAKL